MTVTYLLRQDVVIEPLIARWHAWSHLVSPATCALHFSNRNLPIMRSYVEAPEVHQAACDDPDLLGGQFLDLGGERVNEIAALIQSTEVALAPLLALSDALLHAWKLLRDYQDGRSLADVYSRLDPALCGYVEFVYSPSGSPDLRLFEPMLYRSPVYIPTLQGALIHEMPEEERSFVLSTPRLDTAHSFYLARPFVDHSFDLLGRLRVQPQSMEVIQGTLGLSVQESEDFLRFLVQADSPISAPKPEARCRYFGHACILVETSSGQSVIVDPVVAYASNRMPSRYSMADLPETIDYALITHNHSDHLLLESLLALRWRIKTVLVPSTGGSLVDPSLRLALQAVGFHDVRCVDCLDSVVDGDQIISAIPFMGEHGDLDIRGKTAWSVTAEGQQLVFAADSNNLCSSMYQHLSDELGRIRILFLGMECRGAPMSWLYGPLLPEPLAREIDQSRRLDGSNADRAIALVKALDVVEVKIYALGMEPWMKFISSLQHSPDSPALQQSDIFIERCRNLGISAERLFGQWECLLQEDEEITI
jgi:L-ascorbate metabolism protein UlaG (beta-lactamase superfamily)